MQPSGKIYILEDHVNILQFTLHKQDKGTYNLPN